MGTVEIVILSCGAFLFFCVILHLLGFKFKKAFNFLFKKREKKEKKSKVNKKVKTEKISDVVKEPEKKEPEKKEKAFKITKKGVAKISKKAIERDSRSGAIIEQAIKREIKTQETEKKSPAFDNFDDFLAKLQEIGDPDEMDDETFRNMFLSNYEEDDELSDGFVSSESPSSGPINRSLKHFTIDGKHLNLDKNYTDYPSRMPTLDMDHFVFTDRLTGRYDNIRMGDVSNILSPSSEKQEEKKNKQNIVEEDDEEIFAKIIERRRRELGIASNKDNEKKNGSEELNIRDVVIADMIMNPVSKKNKLNG